MKSAVVVLLLSLATGIAAAGETLRGRIIAVLDGDTVTLLDESRSQHRIRLAQIDAPEIGHGRNKPGQPFGQRSKQSLSDLAFSKDARADCPQTDRYGRQVCTILVGNLDVNLEQVRRGMAWVYRKYANDPVYYRAEDEARNAKRGLWNDLDPIPPWEYRKAGSER